jgi:phosphoglucomutase
MAAKAALEVVQEECGGEDVSIMETQPGMFLEVTEETERLMRQGGTMDPTQLERAIQEDDTMRGWIREMCRIANADDGDEARGCIYGMADAFLDADLGFQPGEVTDATVDAVAV